jgi:ribosomal-protein-alanine N-acetyltransferase
LNRELRIRPARIEDVPAVVALERGVAEAPHWAEAEYEGIVLAEANGLLRRCFFIAENAKAVVGFAVGKIVGNEAELESVVVDVETRRVGMGRALCEAVVKWSGDEGAKAIDLEVRSANAAAVYLYRKIGFVGVGSRRKYYQAPVDDAILMQMVIGE